MQSKQVAVAGILTGMVLTGLGAVVLVGGLAEAEEPDRDPSPGHEEIGTGLVDVDPLPPLAPSEPVGEPSSGSTSRPGGIAVDEHEGETYVPGETSSTVIDEPAGPKRTREPEPDGPGGSTPTSGPTPTRDPKPTTEPSETTEPTEEPIPTETPTETTDPPLVEVG
ncbi:hypothetical protein J2S40_002127 [Nocardioides luteus]|uniref:Uncharacterized protein n=1 Tax=Nocardioides luteus TaxID=1844 RepID=A0ABQ5SSH6_9ACTN|nr:hypothetical protein [Nocardioides luteus]MDR7311069.1 hypothetical protein [Nocardioides luteus]GGR68016.1 hypothetical protein GCM10010197_39340 [Nocardioides luteus]GLJ66615.1 hypothetical protein GCM10017579_06510 [Nocardioides luteus]